MSDENADISASSSTRLTRLDSTRRRRTDPAAERPRAAARGLLLPASMLPALPCLHVRMSYVIVRRETLLVVAESRSRLHACVMQR